MIPWIGFQELTERRWEAKANDTTLGEIGETLLSQVASRAFERIIAGSSDRSNVIHHSGCSDGMVATLIGALRGIARNPLEAVQNKTETALYKMPRADVRAALQNLGSIAHGQRSQLEAASLVMPYFSDDPTYTTRPWITALIDQQIDTALEDSYSQNPDIMSGIKEVYSALKRDDDLSKRRSTADAPLDVDGSLKFVIDGIHEGAGLN